MVAPAADFHHLTCNFNPLSILFLCLSKIYSSVFSDVYFFSGSMSFMRLDILLWIQSVKMIMMASLVLNIILFGCCFYLHPFFPRVGNCLVKNKDILRVPSLFLYMFYFLTLIFVW